MEDVAERAGYRITGETGSALIAGGRGSSFYIWATEGTPEAIKDVSRREKWPPFHTVEGVQVYGDESLWRWWVLENFVVWLQAGPSEKSHLPSLDGIASLVRASETLQLPR